jgi:carbonic anhydrase/acetyltransferase-like protein (isoleucine patch superfamily)
MTDGFSNTTVGEDVTVGHGVILHGCSIGDRCLIGMGSVLLDRAEIGAGSVVGARSLVTQNMQVPPGMLVLGSPARVLRAVNEREARLGIDGAHHYVETSQTYRQITAHNTPK